MTSYVPSAKPLKSGIWAVRLDWSAATLVADAVATTFPNSLYIITWGGPYALLIPDPHMVRFDGGEPAATVEGAMDAEGKDWHIICTI